VLSSGKSKASSVVKEGVRKRYRRGMEGVWKAFGRGSEGG